MPEKLQDRTTYFLFIKCLDSISFKLGLHQIFPLKDKIEFYRGGGDRVPSCRHRAGGVGQFLAGMQLSTKVLKCVVIC